MTTANDIIQDSLEMLGVYSPGDTMSNADAQRGLSTLNSMLDSWSNESLACFAILEQSGSLVAGTSTYTIGSGGAFNVTRPIRLIDGPGAAYSVDVNGNRYPIDVVPRDQWNLIGNVSSIMTSNYPTTLFYDPQYPLGVMNFWPTPNIGITAYWDSYLQLTDFSSLTATMSLPPGYYEALTTNLAVNLKPYFTTFQLDPVVAIRAAKALGNIKRSNIRPVEAVYDPEIVASGSTKTYNPYTDSYGR